MEILRVNNLRKSYKSEHTMVEALDIENFSVEKGDFDVITGASGSGKSTFLHMLGSVDEPTCGQIWIDGEELTAMDEKQKAKLRRQKIGIIYQFYNLIPFLNMEKIFCCRYQWTAERRTSRPAIWTGKIRKKLCTSSAYCIG